MRLYLNRLTQFLCAWALWHRACVAASGAETQANVMTEITFTANRSHTDPFNGVTLDVVFAESKGRELRVPAFWAGGNLWKVRYASPVVGTHRFRTECSDTTDTGLHGVKGKIIIKPYTGDNPLYRHGPLRASRNRRFLEHQDGTPFFWLGDTWWMGFRTGSISRMNFSNSPRTGFKRALPSSKSSPGFIRICFLLTRGAPMKRDFPWETNYSCMRPHTLTQPTNASSISSRTA